MKTYEEIVSAMNEICAEAGKSEIPFCAAVCAAKSTTVVTFGAPVILLGLADMIKLEVTHKLTPKSKRLA